MQFFGIFPSGGVISDDDQELPWSNELDHKVFVSSIGAHLLASQSTMLASAVGLGHQCANVGHNHGSGTYADPTHAQQTDTANAQPMAIQLLLILRSFIA